MLDVTAVSNDGTTAYIELPFAEQGSLADWAQAKARNDLEKRDAMRQALIGLAHLHHEGIVHKVC